MTKGDGRTATTRCQLEDERDEARARRRLMTSGCTILGVAPFLHALAPHFLPALIRGLSALWSATFCALMAAGAEELLLWRERRRWACRCPRPDHPD